MRQIWRFKAFLLLFPSLSGLTISAQSDSAWHQKPGLTVSGFADLFYVYDFNKPLGTLRQPFLFNHNRHNELNWNLGFVKLNVVHPRYRANLALHTGTYAIDNYTAEEGVLKNLFEANVGISFGRKNRLWLDAGILPSHIGFETAISIDNWTLTRSILAENSPYFLTGAKLTYRPSDVWEMAGLILNGWQRIQKVQGNSVPSFGTQVTYTPSDKFKLNWSTFIGTDDPDTTRRMRYFSNAYGQFQLTKKVGLIAGFDIGIQQRHKGSAGYSLWYSPVILGQYTIDKRWKTAARVEFYQDKAGVIIRTGTNNGFSARGFSVNIDYLPKQNIACRIEGRWLWSKGNVFETNTLPTNNNVIIAASIAIKFSDTIN